MPKITPETEALKKFTNSRILQIMNYVIANKINDIEDETRFMKSIGYDNVSNLSSIKRGIQSFQLNHINNLCELYNISADFLLNKNCHTMFLDIEKYNPMERLKIATKEMEIYIEELEGELKW